MTGKQTLLLLDEKCDQTLEGIKNIVKCKVKIGHIDQKKPFVLYTGASDKAIGSMLAQDNIPVWFLSKKLTRVQLNYTVKEKESLHIAHTLEGSKHILSGSKVTMYTDHSNLLYLKESKLGRTQRWYVTLAEFDLDVKYIPGSQNKMADFLSRYFYEELNGMAMNSVEKEI